MKPYVGVRERREARVYVERPHQMRVVLPDCLSIRRHSPT